MRRRQFHIWLLAASMAALAAVLAVPGILADPGAAEPDLKWLALLPLFALAEVVVIHLPTQRNAHGHTLREIPAVLGLTFLAPQQYVTAYVAGAVLALVLAARMRGTKLAFNTAMFALEAALGVLAYEAILQGGDPLSPTGWVAVTVAVLITDVISAGAVTAAISLTEGVFDGEVLHEALRSGSVAAFINTCVALLVATLVLVQPSALPLLGIMVVLLVMAYRVYISLARGHAQTQLLYRFVDRTSSVTSSEEVVEIVLREAADLMHAERAFLFEVDDADEQLRCVSLVGGSIEVETLDLPETRAWWWSALDAGVVRYEKPRAGQRDVPEPQIESRSSFAPRDGLAARLRGAGHARCILVVCDRSFEKETFGAEDVRAFEALAAHAGVAVERAGGVSELEALAAELETARDAALEASEAKSMFLANMSHEIRTPLTVVLASCELLIGTPLNPVQEKLLTRMHRSGGLLLSLVENILDFSRIEAGHAIPDLVEFDLRAVVADIADAHSPRAQQKGVGLHWTMDPRVPQRVVGDSTRVAQIMNILVDNALKFTTTGCVQLDVRPHAGSGELLISISDTGIGIPKKHHATIFDVFSQVDGSAARRYEGTGLGLAICKQLAELMGGTISVDSEPGVGSAFTVRLPLRTTEPARSLAAADLP